MVSIRQREAKYGEKMIEVKVRFWTNNIAYKEGLIKPKHAWASGVVRMERNDSHDIVPSYPVPFNSLMEISSVIERVLIEHGVQLHCDRKMAKYIKSSP